MWLTGLVGVFAIAGSVPDLSAQPWEEGAEPGESVPTGEHDVFGGPGEGQRAPAFVLQSVEGKTVALRDYLGKQPVVLELGSYTCPVFRQRHGAMEDLAGRYGDRAAFLVLYTVEAHPEGDPSPYAGREWVTQPNQEEGILYRQPRTIQERTKLASAARSRLGIKMPMLLDDLRNSTWTAYGEAPNAAYLIGTDGRVKLRQGWFEPRAFEAALRREVPPDSEP
jgi:hypothetical protein